MKISARVHNSHNHHDVKLETNGNAHSITIAPKPAGFGSSANGGELLFLALATCYCNDIYREAAKRSLQVDSVEVEVSGDFGAEGVPATNVTYRAKVAARANKDEIAAMMRDVDRIAEVQNTLRVATPVVLEGVEAVSV